MPTTRANLLSSLYLLEVLTTLGLKQMVICPGSRSGPLAVAAGILENAGKLEIFTSIDERSAAFFAIGAARASSQAVVILTTSGTAVANTLPAVVEAEKSAIPIIILTADRPSYLKNCGANQTVSQERFLMNVCRWLGHGSLQGLATMTFANLTSLAKRAWIEAHGIPPGPVHLNLPLDEPLHINKANLQQILDKYQGNQLPQYMKLSIPNLNQLNPKYFGELPYLDPDQPGIIIAGPWRGHTDKYPSFVQSISRLQKRTSWPILADPLSGLRGCSELTVITTYDLFLKRVPLEIVAKQILRIGSISTSRQLQEWLKEINAYQVLITESDPRPQDSLHLAQQWSGGFTVWCNLLPLRFWKGQPSSSSNQLACEWKKLEKTTQDLLSKNLLTIGSVNEPSLARILETLIPADWPIMLANSSPIRDWENFTQNFTPHRIESFRGASGIDGTLSLAMGLASIYKRILLISGDLALLHDSNGWLWQQQISKLQIQVIIVLIDNSGGGIFEQLPIRTSSDEFNAISLMNFEKLFTMPQSVDHRILASAHGISSRIITCLEELKPALQWAHNQPLTLLSISTNRFYDAKIRYELKSKVNNVIQTTT